MAILSTYTVGYIPPLKHTHKTLAHKMGHCYTERKRVDRIYKGNLVTTRCAKSPSNWRLPSGEGWVKNEEWLRLRDSQRPEERGGFSSAAPHSHMVFRPLGTRLNSLYMQARSVRERNRRYRHTEEV